MAFLTLWCALPAMAGPRLAVLDFEVASSDTDHAPLGVGMRSMLSTDLSKAPDVVVVEREQLEAVLAELELQSGKAVDDKTAVKLGRLVGASHLVDGSVTVQGEVMRLDARLVDVENGTVTVAETVQGERLAFFELEKDLVKRLIVGLAVQLAPKDRAKLGRVHTADWEAFVAFSEGVSAFDQDKYEAAMAALDKAIAVDGEFDLAELTQKEFAAILERLEQREEDLRTAEIETTKLVRSEKAAEALALIRKLEGIAAKEGEAARPDRLTALAGLAWTYERGPPSALISELDGFQAERLSEHYQRLYIAEAQEQWGVLKPDPDAASYSSLERFERTFSQERKRLTYERFSEADRPKRIANDLDNCTSRSIFGRAFYLDMRERVDRCVARQKAAIALYDDPEYAARFTRSLARMNEKVGRFDEAVRLWLRYAESLDDERDVKEVRGHVERLRTWKKALADSAHPEVLREALLGGKDLDYASERLASRQLDGEGRYLLTSLRNLNRRVAGLNSEPYLLVGEQPAWPHTGRVFWTSGPRLDALRTDSLTWFRPADRGDIREGTPMNVPSRMLYGDHPRAGFGLSLTVRHEPDALWWPISVHPRNAGAKHGVRPARARVGLLLGAHDMDVRPRRVPGEDPVVHRPFTAWIVRFDEAHVELVRVQRDPEDRSGRVFVEERLQRIARKGKPGSSTQVRLNVSSNGSIDLKLDGNAHRLKIPDYKPGYPGLMMEDEGFARFEAFELSDQ